MSTLEHGDEARAPGSAAASAAFEVAITGGGRAAMLTIPGPPPGPG